MNNQKPMIAISDRNFIAIDVELNNTEEGLENPKLIQIGVCVGNINVTEDNWSIFTWFIDPKEPINPFITTLTGITDNDVLNHSTEPKDIAIELSNIIKAADCYISPVQWGQGDDICIKNFFKEKRIEFSGFGRRNIDVKSIIQFQTLANGNPSLKCTLASALRKHKMKFIGEQHRAEIDAYNTLRLFFKLIETYRNILV